MRARRGDRSRTVRTGHLLGRTHARARPLPRPGLVPPLERRVESRVDVVPHVASLLGARLLAAGCGQPFQPLPRLGEHLVAVAVVVVDVAAVGTRIRTQEDDRRAEPAEAEKRIRHPLVGDVAVGVDDEPVAAEGVADRPRLDEAQVDPAGRELLQQVEQASGPVVGQFRDDARLVGAGRGRDARGAADQHEACHRVRVVADVLGEHLQVVVVDDAGRRDRGVGRASVEQGRGGRHVARGGQVAVGRAGWRRARGGTARRRPDAR